MERSWQEEGDIKLRREAAMRSLASQLEGTRGAKAEEGATTPVFTNNAPKDLEMHSLVKSLAQQSVLQLSCLMLDGVDLQAYFCTSHAAGHSLSATDTTTVHRRSVRQRLRDLDDNMTRHRFVMTTGA